MKCHPNNVCMGAYGNCLDVKITNICNGSCAFCIEKNGYQPKQASVGDMILATVQATEFDKVLILGGEPLLYPPLVTYLAGIYPHKEAIYLTTNGSHLTPRLAGKIGQYLDAINISIHHYDEEVNDSIYKTATVDFEILRQSIKVLHEYDVSVRINCVCNTDGIKTRADVEKMIELAKLLQADEIRFAEVQNDTKHFVDLTKVFNVPENPFKDGCETTLKNFKGIRVIVRTTCGYCNPLREKYPRDNGDFGKTCAGGVLYPDAEIYDGWVKQSRMEVCDINDECCHQSRMRRMLEQPQYFGHCGQSEPCEESCHPHQRAFGGHCG